MQQLDPIFKTLAPGRGDIPRTPGREKLGGTAEEGYIYCGPSGAGHFVKMVHNGIEYGIMQAYAEGFDIFRNANRSELPKDQHYDLNLADIAEVWRRGSVVSSWLLDLTAMALAENPTLAEYSGFVQDSGEGRWTIEAAIEEAVPVDVLSARSVRALPFAAAAHFCRENSFRHAAEIRRARRTCDQEKVRLSPKQSIRRNSRRMAIHRKIANGTSWKRLPQTQQRTPGRPADPCIMVIFGAAGDLTRRKLIPALYNLAKAQLLSREFAIVGVARTTKCPTTNSARKLADDITSLCGAMTWIPTSGSGSRAGCIT